VLRDGSGFIVYRVLNSWIKIVPISFVIQGEKLQECQWPFKIFQRSMTKKGGAILV